MANHFPFGLAILSLTGYHLVQRMTPASTNPLAMLTVAYTIAAAISGLMLLSESSSLCSVELKTVNLASCLGLTLAVVGTELGFLMAYRNGLSLSTGALTVTVAATIILASVAITLWEEPVTFRQAIGALHCRDWRVSAETLILIPLLDRNTTFFHDTILIDGLSL